MALLRWARHSWALGKTFPQVQFAEFAIVRGQVGRLTTALQSVHAQIRRSKSRVSK